jgi:hypothetical protein
MYVSTHGFRLQLAGKLWDSLAWFAFAFHIGLARPLHSYFTVTSQLLHSYFTVTSQLLHEDPWLGMRFVVTE